MKLYDIRCKQCGWKAPLPVDEETATEMCKHRCRICLASGSPDIRFTASEHIAVGAFTHYLPGKKRERQ